MVFLWWYGPALVLAVLLGLRLKRVTGSAPTRPLTFEEIGYLGGGPVRAAEVAVAGLVADNRARLSGTALAAVPTPEPTASTALQDVLATRLDRPRDLDGLLVEVARSAPARRIGQGLVDAGLLVSPKHRLVRAVLCVLPVLALMAAGLATAPAGWLVALVPSVTGVAAVLLLLGPPPVRTRRGARAYEEATAGLAPVDPAEVTARYGLARPAAAAPPQPRGRRADTAVFDGETAEPIGYAAASQLALPRRRRPAVVVEPQRWRKRNGWLVAGGWLAGGWLASEWLEGDDGGDFLDTDFGGFGG